jgi:hypothetical protein
VQSEGLVAARNCLAKHIINRLHAKESSMLAAVAFRAWADLCFRSALLGSLLLKVYSLHTAFMQPSCSLNAALMRGLKRLNIGLIVTE